MKTVQYDFIETIKDTFKSLNSQYAELSVAYNQLHTTHDEGDNLSLARAGFTEFDDLNEKMLDWYLSKEAYSKGHLEREMEYNISNGQYSYYQYVQNIFQEQNIFLRELGSDILETYSECDRRIHEYEQVLVSYGWDIKEEDFIELFKVYYILLFRWLERQFKDAYEHYYAAVSGKSITKAYLERIKLAYEGDNVNVIDLFYEELIGKKFHVGKAEFITHFTDDYPKMRIPWHGTQKELAALFTGMELMFLSDTPIVAIDVLNESRSTLIHDHFALPNGKTFKKNNLFSMTHDHAVIKAKKRTPLTDILEKLHDNYN